MPYKNELMFRTVISNLYTLELRSFKDTDKRLFIQISKTGPVQNLNHHAAGSFEIASPSKGNAAILMWRHIIIGDLIFFLQINI